MWGNPCLSAVPRVGRASIVARVHRTTTTTAFLVTVAVAALSGCTTVQHPSAPGPPRTPSVPPAQRPEPGTEPQIVQAPAREALELIGPSRGPDPTPPVPRRPSATPPAPIAKPPERHPVRHEPRADRPPRSVAPSDRLASRPPLRPQPSTPGLSAALGEGTDICALGRRYGGWHPDSPESLTCEQVHGNR